MVAGSSSSRSTSSFQGCRSAPRRFLMVSPAAGKSIFNRRRCRSEDIKSVKSWLPRKCVVVPFDFSEKLTQSLEFARAFVADLADLHVVHVVSEAFDAVHGMAWDATDDDPCATHVQKCLSRSCCKQFFVRSGLSGAIWRSRSRNQPIRRSAQG